MCTFFQETKIDSGITQDGENLEAVATTPIEEPLNTSKMSLISDLKPNSKKPRDEACNLEVPMSSVASEITVEKIGNRMNGEHKIYEKPYVNKLVIGNAFNLFMTSASPKIRIPIVQIFCYDYFCLIKSSVNHSGITKPFLNPDIMFTSNCL